MGENSENPNIERKEFLDRLSVQYLFIVIDSIERTFMNNLPMSGRC